MSEKKTEGLLDRMTGPLVVAAVVGATVIVPLGAWIANRFFGLQMPAFLQPVIDFFQA